MTVFQKVASLSVVGVALAVGGCASDDIREIPTTAIQMSDARGPITVTAPGDGIVYVYDTSNNQLVYSAKLSAGDILKLDTSEKDILVNGRKVASKALIRDHRHQVYFDRTPGRTVTEPQTTIVEPETGRTTVVTPSAPADTSRTTIVGPDGKQTTVVTPAPDRKDTTIITTPSR
jgi:hypothetical protein